MPSRLSLAPLALIGATVVTAAGLNLAVMQLDDSALVTEGVAAEAVVPSASGSAQPDQVALTSALPTSAATSAVVTAPVNTAASAASVSVASPADPVDDVEESSTTAATAPTEPAPGPEPSTPVAPTTSAPSPPPPQTLPPEPTAPPPTTEYLTYEFEGVASIIIALHDGDELEFWSATPEPGWGFKVEDKGPRKVKIKFRPLPEGEEAEFEAKLDDGRIKVKREY